MNVRRTVLTTSAAVIGAGVLGVGALAGVASANGRPTGNTAPSASATCVPGTGTGTSGPAGRGPSATQAGTTAGRTGAGNGATGDGATGNGNRANRPTTASTGPMTSASGQGTLTTTQQQDLAFMVEEEKLAHDVYTTLAATYDVPAFSRIAASETQHLTVLRAVAAGYGIAVPSSDAVGVFADAGLATMYTDLVAQGRTSLAEAYGVGRTIELDDLARLAQASEGLTAPDLQQAYARLASASQQHLAAFGG